MSSGPDRTDRPPGGGDSCEVVAAELAALRQELAALRGEMVTAVGAVRGDISAAREDLQRRCSFIDTWLSYARMAGELQALLGAPSNGPPD